MSNNNTRGNNQAQQRSPRFIWVVRPSYTTGECRAYFNQEDAIKDFGLPSEEWVETEENVLEINSSPDWDNDFDIAWRLEKVEILSLGKAPVVEPKAPVTAAVVTPKESVPAPVPAPSK